MKSRLLLAVCFGIWGGAAAQTNSAVTAQAEDAQLKVYPLTVESVTTVPGLNWLTEVVVVLPDNLPAAADVLVSVTWQTRTSNKVRIKIK